MKSRLRPLFPLLFLFMALLAFFLTVELKWDANVIPDQLPIINKKTRLLVIAPHCDDEVLGAYGLINNVKKRQGQVQVVILTNGDASFSAIKYFKTNQLQSSDYIRFGELRQNESRRAMNLMGVSPSDIFFLTYPDKGLSPLWTKHWSATNPYTSNYTRANYSPYSNSYYPKVPYTGINLYRDLARIINRFHPTIVVYPHPSERHPDHWAAYAFVKYVLEGNYNRRLRELLYLVHYNQWPAPIGLWPTEPLKPPVELTDTTWIPLTLSPSQVNQKRELIYNYTTQMTYLPNFMLSFARKNELFGDKPTTLVFPGSHLILYQPPKPFNEEPILPGRISSLNLAYTQKDLKFQLKVQDRLTPGLTYYLDLTLFQKKGPPIRVVVIADQERVRILPSPTSSRAPFLNLNPASNLKVFPNKDLPDSADEPDPANFSLYFKKNLNVLAGSRLKKGGVLASLGPGFTSGAGAREVDCNIQITRGLKSILAGSYIYQKNSRIDKTAWQFIKLQ